MTEVKTPATTQAIPKVAAAPKTSRKRAAPAAKAAPTEAKPAPASKKPAAEKVPSATQAIVADAPQEAKPAKTKKAKLIRDSFTMPEAEYQAIAAIKKRCLGAGVAAKKSEVLRAAVAALAKLNDVDLMVAIQSLEVIKTGRPVKGGK